MASFEDRLNEKYAEVLNSPIRAASPAGLERRSLIPWVIGAALVGLAIAELVGSEISQGLVLGVSGGAGLVLAVYRDHRRMSNSDAQPGGGAVVVAVTDTDVVILERSLWTLKTFSVLEQSPFAEFTSIEVPLLVRRRPVAFQRFDGETWRYVIPNVTGLVDALPDSLQPS